MSETANKRPVPDIVSRLSKLQLDIVTRLTAMPQPIGGNISLLPRTGDIIDAVGRRRTPSNYAVVSRALRRLEDRGIVSSYASIMAARGQGVAYALTVGEKNTGRGVAMFRLDKPRHRTVPRYTKTIDI